MRLLLKLIKSKSSWYSAKVILSPFLSLKELATVKKYWEEVTDPDPEMADMEWKVVMAQD